MNILVLSPAWRGAGPTRARAPTGPRLASIEIHNNFTCNPRILDSHNFSGNGTVKYQLRTLLCRDTVLQDMATKNRKMTSSSEPPEGTRC
jgi:hypothetical protein